ERSGSLVSEILGRWSGTTVNVQLATWMPSLLTLIGVQPERLADFGGSLSDCVRAQLAPAVSLAVEELAAWGYAPRLRSAPPAERLNAAALELEAYEAGRPAEDVAWRVGDARFLNIRHAVLTREGR
ncbi:MAG: hypothetical protein N3D71_07440, partial [Burkholderiaceae bacterium]|nr:hypothetical protein [Burkholderiaceae bacterium]